VCISYHTTHTTTAERRAEKEFRRRGGSSGQKTKRGIDGANPAAAGIGRFFFSLKGPRYNVSFFVQAASLHAAARAVGGWG